MADPEPNVSVLPRPLPTEIELDAADPMIPHTPKELSLLKQITGKRFTDLVGEDADDGERFTVMVWLKLRREGFDPTWDEAGNVLIRYVNAMPDPTSGAPSMTSPHSADSGDAPRAT